MTWVHLAAVAAFALAVGASVGSFLNVCVWRIPRGESVIRPRSRCPQCRSSIATRDNIPVLGWLLLRGRCRSCARPRTLPSQYWLVRALSRRLVSTGFFARSSSSAFTPLPASSFAMFTMMSATSRARGDRLTAYIALYNLSQVELGRGDHDRARRPLQQAVNRCDDRHGRSVPGGELREETAPAHERFEIELLVGAIAAPAQPHVEWVPDREDPLDLEALREHVREAQLERGLKREWLGPEVEV